MKLYLDTNVFLSATESTDPFHKIALQLFESLEEQKNTATTSVETFQEIVYVAKRLKKLSLGIELCRQLLHLIPDPLAIDQPVLDEFLSLVAKFSRLDTRDCLHLAVCIECKIPYLITEDVDLRKSDIPNLKIISIKQALEI